MPGTWYVQRGRSDPLGPFSTEEILEGLAHGEIPRDSLVREIAATAWLPFAAVPEFRDALSLLAPAPDQDERRLAPKPGPAWRSAADRHLVRGAPGDAPPAAPAPSTAKAPATRAAPMLVRPPEVATASIAVGALVAALGVVWTFVRLGALLTPPEGWRAIVDRFHVVRDGALADLALAVCTYPLLFVGIFAARARARYGIPLVRAVARVGSVANIVVTAWTLARLQGSPRLAEVSSTTTLLAIVAGAPLLLAACAASLLWLFPAPSSEVEAPSEALLSTGLAAAFLATAFVLFTLAVDVVVVAAAGEAFVYSDPTGLRLYVEGRREGVAGAFKLDHSRDRGFALLGPTRGRFVRDFSLALDGGGAQVGREVELLEGPRAGAHVYLLPEDARLVPP